MLAVAADAGHTGLCEELTEAGLQPTLYAGRLAGNANVIEWLLGALIQRPTQVDIDVYSAGIQGVREGLSKALWANAAYSGHVDLMRVLKGDSPITPEDLQAVARGCPLAVLAEMVQEFEQSPSDGPLTNHQENMNLGGALISPIPDWQEKAGWLLRRMPCGPALSLDHPSAQEFARLPDAQQRLDWLAEAAPGLRYYDDRICWAAEAGRADLVMKLWYPPTEEALQDSAGFDWYTAFLSDAVPHGHMGLAQELLALGAPVGVWGLASAAGSTGRVGMAQWAVGVIRQEQEKEAAAAAAAAAGMGSGTGGASAADIRPPPSPPPPLPQQQLLQQEQQKKGARSSSAEAAAQAASVAEGGGGQPQVEGQEESIVTDGNREVLECMLKYSLGSGSLELVRWLRARGVPWGACVLHYAAESGNEALVEWMVQLGYDVEQVGGHGWLQGVKARLRTRSRRVVLMRFFAGFSTA